MRVEVSSQMRLGYPGSRPWLEAARDARHKSCEQMRILVVEDDPIQQLVLVSLLNRHGHEVIAVSDGTAAWNALRRSNFNIVFTDWMMPGMSSFERSAARALGGTFTPSYVPVDRLVPI